MAVTRTGKLAAIGAVVVGHHQESGIRINRFAVEGQVFDAFCLRINGLTFAVIFCGLGNVNLIFHAVDHVEVVGAETVPVNQRLRFAAVRIDLVELPGRALQPLLHLFPGGFHHHEGVGIEVEIGGITEGQLAFLHLNVAGRIVLPPAHFEWRRGRQYRQICQIRIALNIVLRIGFLRHVDYLHGRVILYQREEAVHVISGFTDRLADKFTRRVVVMLQDVDQLFIFLCQRFFGRCVVDRTRFRFRLRDFPASAVVIQHQIHHAKVVAPHARHHRWHTVERPFFDVRAFDISEIFAREDGVGVTKQDRIHARHLAEIVHGVLSHHLIRVGREARVRHDDDHIRPFRPHLRHVFARGFGNVVDGHFPVEVGFIPRHDLRRHKTDIADFQRLFFTVLVDNLGLFNQIRGEERLLRLNVDDIGVNVREFRSCQRVVQVFQAVVKFVVAQVADGIVQRIHCLINRMDLAFFQPLRRHVVSERAALN
ncbi:Uncharacterised protein [Enterobacter hormaechei]|nr:Uncharacterised protein [Enterobacter hormaechei]